MSKEIIQLVDVVSSQRGLNIYSSLSRDGEETDATEGHFSSFDTAEKKLRRELRIDNYLYLLAKGAKAAEAMFFAFTILKDAIILLSTDQQKNIDPAPFLVLIGLYIITSNFKDEKNNDIVLGESTLNTVREAQKQQNPQFRKTFKLK
jgi:hypothetical protein